MARTVEELALCVRCPEKLFPTSVAAGTAEAGVGGAVRRASQEAMAVAPPLGEER